MEQYRKVYTKIDIVILGEVHGTKVTLIGCYMKSAASTIGYNDVSIYAVPSEIIVGGCFSSEPMAKEIIISTSDLNYMFLGYSPLEFNIDFSKDNSSVLNYTFPKPIVANDKYGEIRFFQTFETQWTVDFYKHNIISLIEYSFTEPLPILSAVEKVAAARNLFSFFGNGYISLGDITFIIYDDKKIYDLWLNYTEDILSVKEPFLISIFDFKNQFQNVWDAWLAFCESAAPIVDLFYEIICNHSTRVNSFLNLSQAIEVYSNAFRYNNAKELAENNGQLKSKREIPLKFIYQDILSEYSDSLELIESNIANYAQGLSDMRNYYTHYNSDKYVKPTYSEVYSASRVLRFVLLTIVYTAVGISKDSILECKKRYIFREFGNDVETILKYSNKKK